MSVNTTANEAPKWASRRIISTIIALPFGFALISGWSISSGASGCAGPVSVEPRNDLGSTAMPDASTMMMTTQSRFVALLSTAGALYSDAPPLPAYQQWKRDPSYLADGTDQYMYYAGSSYPNELWILGVYKSTGSQTPPNWSTGMQALPGTANSWETQDQMAPTVYVSTGAPKFVMYYAATGDTTRPDYVTQIGRATSNDGMTFTRSGTAPVLAVPTFDGTTQAAAPTTQRPDAYGVTDPSVLVDGSDLVLYYAGLDCAAGADGTCTYKIFRTVSTDNGLSFPPGEAITLGTGPNAPGGIAGPSVLKTSAGGYVLAYTLVAAPVSKTRLSVREGLARGSVGIATSSDGKNFTYAGPAATDPLIAKGSSNYSEGAFAPSIYLSGSAIKLWFSTNNKQSSFTYFSILPASLTEFK